MTSEVWKPFEVDGRPEMRERRQVTAFFYDIVGSTEWLAAFEAEDFDTAQLALHQAAIAAIHSRGGSIDQTLGDGGVAYFGHPVPIEDAPEAAIDAAFDLIDRCTRILFPGSDRPLQIRIGIATGTAVINPASDALGRPGGTHVVGLTPALAARVQGEAEPGTVVVAESTYRLTRSAFAFEPLGTRQLKGLAGVQSLWRAIERRKADSRFALSRRPETPLVGRSAALDACRAAWADALAGQGGGVLLTGEAGIGKSRIVAALRAEIEGPGMAARVLQCMPRAEDVPLHPVLDLVRRELGPDVIAAGGELVAMHLAALSPAAGPASLAIVSSLVQGGQQGTGAPSAFSDASPDAAQKAITDAVADLLAPEAGEEPVLLVVEDLHWADAATREILGALLERIRDRRVLAVVTTRDAQAPGHWPATRTLSLGRLDPEEAVRLARSVWHPDPLPPGLAAIVLERGDGVPLFVEELAHFLRDRAAPGVDATGRAVVFEDTPTALEDLLAARLAALGEARRTAQVASVVGRDVPAALLEALLDGEVDAATLERHVARLAAAGILAPVEGSEAGTLRFRHVLLQESAYGSLLRSQRVRLHRRIAEVGRERAFVEMPDEVLAWHSEQAGDFVNAARHGIRAAESFLRRAAHTDAGHLLDAAAGHLERAGEGPHIAELTLDLLTVKGPVVMALSGKAAAREVYEQGVDLCRLHREDERGRWFALYWGWWFTAPDFRTLSQRSRVLTTDMERVADPEARLQAYHCAWATHFHTGRHRQCLACIERGLAFYDPARAAASRDRFGGHDARVCGLGERAQSLWFRGDNAGARASIQEALDWAEETGHLGSRCHALENAVLLHHYLRDPQAVRDFAARIHEVAVTHGLAGFDSKSEIFAGWADGITGDPLAGIARVQRASARHRQVGTQEDEPVYAAMLAELHHLAGQSREGLNLVRGAISHAEASNDRFWIPELWRWEALLARQAGEAQGRWQAALDLAGTEAKAQGALALVARVQAERDRL